MLTAEQRQLAADNHNLIYQVLHERHWSIDEYYDIAAIGLCKAAKAFKSELGYKFSTYACKYIVGEVLHTYRKARAQKRDGYTVGFDEQPPGSYTGTYGDMLAVPSTAQEIAEYSDVMERIKLLKPKQQTAVMLTATGYTQPEIASHMNCSKQAVWRMLQVARKALA